MFCRDILPNHVSLTFLSVATAIASPSHRRLKITISLFLVELLVFEEDCFCFTTTEKTKLVSLHNKLVVYLIYTDRWVSKWLVAESTTFDMIMLSVLNQGYLNSLEKIILNWELFVFQNMIAIQAGKGTPTRLHYFPLNPFHLYRWYY